MQLLWLAASMVAIAAVAPRSTPTGAAIEGSGFATILAAPPMPVAEQSALPPAGDERTIYARIADVGHAEAARRVEEQERVRPEFERLLRRLRREQAGNFTDARMIHRPDWVYVFYFKRAPQQTLAKYTRNPHFKAARARYSHKELQAIAAPWVARFEGERLLTGHGTDATFGEVRMDLVVSEAEFRAIAAREGWGPLPDAIKLAFAEDVRGEAVLGAVSGLVRIFAQSDRNLGITNQMAVGGRIVLRDGCFYVTGRGQPDRLAYFPREVGLTLDGEGYLAFRSRVDGKLIGRVGEDFTWGGPIGLRDDAPMLGELKARCGGAEVEHVGMISSTAAFRARYGV